MQQYPQKPLKNFTYAPLDEYIPLQCAYVRIKTLTPGAFFKTGSSRLRT